MERWYNTWTPKSIKSWNRKLQDSKFDENGAIKPSTEEFEQIEPKLDENVSFEPPLAHKPTQFWFIMEIELPELLPLSISAPSIDYRRRGLKLRLDMDSLDSNNQESHDS